MGANFSGLLKNWTFFTITMLFVVLAGWVSS